MILLLTAALLLQDPVPSDRDGENAAKTFREVAAKATIEGKIAALQEALKVEHEKVIKAVGELGWQSAAGRLNEMLSKVGEADVRPLLPDVLQTLGQLGSAGSVDPIIDLLTKLENGGRKNPWPNEGPMRRAGEDALR